MILVDANILLAVLNTDDIQHKAAKDLWKEIESLKFGNFFITDYIFNEIIGVTFRKYGKNRARKIGQHIIETIHILIIDQKELYYSWQFFIKSNLKLNLVDCTNLSALNTYETRQIATFDKEFNKVKGIEVVS